MHAIVKSRGRGKDGGVVGGGGREREKVFPQRRLAVSFPPALLRPTHAYQVAAEKFTKLHRNGGESKVTAKGKWEKKI